jgi:hypothetical protein
MRELENKQTRVVGAGRSRRAALERDDLERLLLKRGKRTVLRDEDEERICAAWRAFYSLHRRRFVARSKGRNGEESDFRRRSIAYTGLFEPGSVSKPSASR